MWENAVVAYFKVQSWHPGMEVRIVTAWANVFGLIMKLLHNNQSMACPHIGIRTGRGNRYVVVLQFLGWGERVLEG
jgi:hypothetical protein